jgi:hypothetical protein
MTPLSFLAKLRSVCFICAYKHGHLGMGHRPDRRSCGIIVLHGTSVWFGGLKNLRKLLFILLLMSPAISQAAGAPWCLVRDENVFCRFQLADACYAAAAKRGGSCRENFQLHGSGGKQKWCVITTQYRQCSYTDKAQCVRVALQSNGGCVENIERALKEEVGIKITADSTGGCADGDISCQIGVELTDRRLENEDMGGLDGNDF